MLNRSDKKNISVLFLIFRNLNVKFDVGCNIYFFCRWHLSGWRSSFFCLLRSSHEWMLDIVECFTESLDRIKWNSFVIYKNGDHLDYFWLFIHLWILRMNPNWIWLAIVFIYFLHHNELLNVFRDRNINIYKQKYLKGPLYITLNESIAVVVK